MNKVGNLKLSNPNLMKATKEIQNIDQTKIPTLTAALDKITKRSY